MDHYRPQALNFGDLRAILFGKNCEQKFQLIPFLQRNKINEPEIRSL